jgi:hypothetical protein
VTSTAALALDQLRSPVRARPKRVAEHRSGPFPAVSFLVATSTHGVVLYEREQFIRIVPGNCYGITRCGDWWMAFQRQGDFGRVVRFQVVGRRARHLQTVLYGLNYGIHQLDFVGDRLIVVDTLKNRLLVYDGAARLRRASWRRWTCQVYPIGVREVADFRWDRLACRRDATTYRHFNSVFQHDGRLHVVAHNRTVESGRRSQLYVLDDGFTVLEVRDLNAADVHNYWTDGTRELYCASAKGTVRLDGADAVALGGYTRGLSVASDLLLVGSSRFEPERRAREQGDGCVHAIAPDLTALGHVTLPRTQIHEIRRLDATELGLSNEDATAAVFTVRR